MAEDFGNFFSTIVTELNIGNRYNHFLSFHNNDPIVNAIKIYENQIVKNEDSFSFIHIDEDTVRKEISLLDASKSSPITSITLNVIKENLDLFTKKVNIDFNASIKLGVFHNNLKYADISCFQTRE